MEAATSDERAAHNEVLFREANERLGEKRQELDIGGRTPFICECEKADCVELIRLPLEDYERVRSHPAWFVLVSGHATRNEHVVEEHDTYVIVEKVGASGRIASEANPRA